MCLCAICIWIKLFKGWRSLCSSTERDKIELKIVILRAHPPAPECPSLASWCFGHRGQFGTILLASRKRGADRWHLHSSYQKTGHSLTLQTRKIWLDKIDLFPWNLHKATIDCFWSVLVSKSEFFREIVANIVSFLINLSLNSLFGPLHSGTKNLTSLSKIVEHLSIW